MSIELKPDLALNPEAAKAPHGLALRHVPIQTRVNSNTLNACRVSVNIGA